MNVFYRSECKYKKLCFVNETVEPYLKSGIKNVKSQFLKEIKITWKSDILKTQKPWKSLKPWKLSFRFCLTAKIQNSDLKKPEKYFPRFPSFWAALIIIKKAITYLDKYAWSYFREYGKSCIAKTAFASFASCLTIGIRFCGDIFLIDFGGTLKEIKRTKKIDLRLSVVIFHQWTSLRMLVFCFCLKSALLVLLAVYVLSKEIKRIQLLAHFENRTKCKQIFR